MRRLRMRNCPIGVEGKQNGVYIVITYIFVVVDAYRDRIIKSQGYYELHFPQNV